MNHRPLSWSAATVAVTALALVLTVGQLPAAANRHPPASPAKVPLPAAIAKLVRLELVNQEMKHPLAVVAPPGEPVGRLFVVGKKGPIRILRGKKLDPRPFLDLTGKVEYYPNDDSEQGLLGLAFHPRFQSNGRFYLNYTDREGDTQVVEMRTSTGDGKGPQADQATARTLLTVPQPHPNHNGGGIEFGPDGKLYVLMGDGGGADDPEGNAQNPRLFLGKAVRIDVDSPGARPQVVARGLRNPWRYTFDSRTGDLFIADVGQNEWEYVHFVPGGKLSGQNFGWNIVEGTRCFKSSSCDRRGLLPPVLEYSHREGCSITGGHVYRGKALPEIEGAYFFADFCTAMLRSFRMRDGQATDHWDWKATLDPESQIAKVAAFGLDQAGELYLINHEGPIYKLVRK